MAEPTAAHARELGDYLLIARRRWRWILGSAAIGLALALVYLQLAQLTYASTAKVQVASITSDSAAVGARTSDEINLDTEAQLVKSDAVVAGAAGYMDSREPLRRLASRVSVTVPPNTTVLNITYRAPTAADARQGAAAFAQAYLDNREADALEVLTQEEARLSGEASALEAKITKLTSRIAELTGPGQQADRTFLVARRTAMNSQLAQFQAQLAPVKDAAVYPGKISNQPTLPSSPVDPNPLLVIPSGLMAGLLVGVVLAGVRERRDKRIHAAIDVERIFGLKPLARIPWADGRLETPTGVRVDADVRAIYHSLRANGPATTESAVVVAPEADLVGERLGFSMAVVAALAGSSTAYIARPGHVSASDRNVAAGARGLLSLPDYQSIDAMVGNELHASALAKRLRMLRSKHDFLVLGLPNDDPVVDLPLLGRQVDVAVVVVALGRTQRTSVDSVLSSITKSGIEHVAVVILDRPHRRARHRTQQLSVITADSGAPVTGDEVFPDAADDLDRFPRPAVDAPGGGSSTGAPTSERPQGRSLRNGPAVNGRGNGVPRNGGARPAVRPAGGEATS